MGAEGERQEDWGGAGVEKKAESEQAKGWDGTTKGCEGRPEEWRWGNSFS